MLSASSTCDSKGWAMGADAARTASMEQLAASLEGGSQDAFEKLVAALVSQNNAERNQAEQFYKHLLEHKPDLTVQFLTRGLGHQHADMKRFCCVYLRKAVRTDDVWEKCTTETKEMTKQYGMQCLTQEPKDDLMHKLADVMSQIAAQTWEDDSQRWVGILQHMQELVLSTDARMIEIGLILFSKLVDWIDPESTLKPQLRQLHDVLFKCMKHESTKVATAAAKAAVAFIMAVEEDQLRMALAGLALPIVNTMRMLLSSDEAEAREVLMDLALLAETEAGVFKQDFDPICATLISLAKDDQGQHLDEETRQSALEVIVSAVEHKPLLIRKKQLQMRMLCETLMGMLLDVEDTENWHKGVTESDLEDGQGELYTASLQALDRIAKPIGGKFLLPVLWPIIQQWAVDSDWRKRQAALCSIAQIAEGCQRMLIADAALVSLVNVCCSRYNDEHAIVKWSLCQAVGQVCTDLSPKLQRKHHETIMKTLLFLMQPQEEVRVQAHAASAIVNFCEDIDGNIISHYIRPLTESFIPLLGSPSQLVVEAAITAIASLADCSGEMFKPYYDTVMPLLKGILAASNGKSQRRLCGKVLESISLIGLNVGKAVFMKDAGKFMQYLQQLSMSEMDAADPILTYVQSAGTRMCKCLGEDFVALLPNFVPPLLRSAGKKADLETVDEADVDESDDSYEYYPMGGDKVIRISTAFTEEKENALSMLSCYAEHLQEHFAPYVSGLAKVVEHVLAVPLLNNTEMRKTSAAIVPSLFNGLQQAHKKSSYAEASAEAVSMLFEMMVKALLKGLETELEASNQVEMLDALETIVDVAEVRLMTPELVKACFSTINMQIKQLFEDYKRRREMEATQEYEEEDLELMREVDDAEEEVMQQAVEAVGMFLRKLGDGVMPAVEELLKEFFNPMLGDSCPWHNALPALLLLDDVVEFAPSSTKYLKDLVPKFLQCAQSDNKEVVTAALYGLGAVAEKHPTVYPQHHEAVMNLALQLVDRLQGVEDWEHTRDNGVAVLGKVLVFHAQLVPGPIGKQLGSKWLQCLPMVHDDVEAGKQHKLLYEMLLKNDERVLGDNLQNLPKVAEVFVRVIAKGKALLESDNIAPFISFFVSQLKPVLDNHGCRVDEVVKALEPKDRQTFEAAMAGAASA